MTPIRTMVVDDHQDIAVMFETLLAFSHEFTVVSRAKDGEEAIDVAEQTQPDLILLDVMMPKLDGLAALRHLRALAPKAKIVMLSVLSPWIVERRIEEAHAEAVIAAAREGLSPPPVIRPDLIIAKSELAFSFKKVRELFA